ncbi:SRPBCC family protein [Novosphingobium sp.]|uniref:SRPBCC family protein n=1 Tax=Novosphingobium sp. TaxID=1874826 RepID=UPI00286A4C22|nr:SRPBCC family protein [Novosphingobium sp.]
MRKSWIVAAALAGAVLAMPGQSAAEVAVQGESSFVVTLAVEVPAAKADVWKALIAPAKWWSSNHTYSGDAANLYIDSQATGCFCEKIPKPADAPADQRMGSVEHMHIVYADPAHGVLRLTGGLGPLQGEPVAGVWTITLKPGEGGGTQIVWDYAVNGLVRQKADVIGPMIDMVMGEQLARLAGLFAPTDAPASAPTG